MFRHSIIFLIGIILGVPVYAQNFADEIQLIECDGNTVTLHSSAVADKKKDAVDLAVKSAFNSLFHSGIEGVKNGVPMIAAERKDYDYRFFSENRYISYLIGEIKTNSVKKLANNQKATVTVTINLKTLKADLERNNMTLSPGWSDAKTVKATAALNPTIVIVPYVSAADGYSFEAMRQKLERSRVERYAIDRIAEEFQNNGYKTRDFVSQLQNSKNMELLRDGTLTDDATMLVQQLPGDIIVTVEVDMQTNPSQQSELTLNVRAIEKQTNGRLATKPFASGLYMTTDSLLLADHAVKKIQTGFFEQLRSSFDDMVKNGREVYIDLSLAETISDWDFDQDSPGSGESFKDVLDEWLRDSSFRGVYDMSRSTDKYINISLNIPLWDIEKNRSYSLTNFGSDLRRFFRAHLGDDYKADIKALGQKLVVTIK